MNMAAFRKKASAHAVATRNSQTARLRLSREQPKRVANEKMKTPDMERLRIQERAEETFGSHEKAMLWLTRRTKALGNKTPMELLDSESGIRQVEDLLIRIDHGLGA